MFDKIIKFLWRFNAIGVALVVLALLPAAITGIYELAKGIGAPPPPQTSPSVRTIAPHTPERFVFQQAPPGFGTGNCFLSAKPWKMCALTVRPWAEETIANQTSPPTKAITRNWRNSGTRNLLFVDNATGAMRLLTSEPHYLLLTQRPVLSIETPYDPFGLDPHNADALFLEPRTPLGPNHEPPKLILYRVADTRTANATPTASDGPAPPADVTRLAVSNTDGTNFQVLEIPGNHLRWVSRRGDDVTIYHRPPSLSDGQITATVLQVGTWAKQSETQMPESTIAETVARVKIPKFKPW